MKLLIGILPVCLAFLLACSAGKDLAGGSETTNGITARVRYADGSPAVGSAVRLRRADYLSSPADSAQNPVSSIDLVTDSSGRFHISGIDPGDYSIEVYDGAYKGAVLFTCSVGEMDTADLGTDSLSPYAVLTGSVDIDETGSGQLYAQIKGLERVVPVDTNGEFVFYDLPEGFLDVIISTNGGSDAKKVVKYVKANAADTASVEMKSGYQYSGYIYFNTEAAGIPANAAVTDFPLLVRLNSSTFDFGSALLGGDDARFYSKDNKPLHYEIEEWDPVSGKAAIWIKMDTIRGSGSEQYIVMKWGESDAFDQSNGAAVFDTASGFAGVWHFNENPAAGAGAIKDRTFNGFNGTAGNTMSSDNLVSAAIGRGLMFDGSDSIGAGLLDLDESYTLSCWVKPYQNINANWRFIMKEPCYTLWYDTEYGGIRAEHFTDTNAAFTWRGIYQDTPDSIPNPVVLETWYHVASTYDGNKIRLYVNGEVVDSTLSIANNPGGSDNVLFFGGRYGEYFRGVMDEVRIEHVARSAEWIGLCHRNQHPGSEMVKPRLR
ncbi:MAG: DUF2341 domain-containing protein [Chitinispirillaceae bacterium]